MMLCRITNLTYMLEGLKKTGLALVPYDGHNFLPSSVVEDDYGLYIFVPKLALALNLTIPQAIDLFLGGITLCGALISIAGFFKLFTHIQSRCFAIFGVLVLSKISLAMHDIYLVPTMLGLACVPWALYYFAQPKKSSSLLFFLFSAGTCIGFAHGIRAHSGTAVLLFILTLLWMRKSPHKLLSLLTLCAGLGASSLFFQYHLHASHTFSVEHHIVGNPQDAQHPFWHIVYMGLGFINNDLGLSYSDTVASAKATSLDPAIKGLGACSSDRYEATLKQEVFAVVLHHPFYVLRVMVAKLSLIMLYFLLFGFLGLLACFARLFSYSTLAAFCVGLSWSALPGLIAIPSFYYLSGFATFAGILSIIGYHELTRHSYFSTLVHAIITKIKRT